MRTELAVSHVSVDRRELTVVARPVGGSSTWVFRYDRVARTWTPIVSAPDVDGASGGWFPLGPEGAYVLVSRPERDRSGEVGFRAGVIEARTGRRVGGLPFDCKVTVSRDGGRLAVVTRPFWPAKRHSVRIYRTATLEELGRFDVTDGRYVEAVDGPGRRLLVRMPHEKADDITVLNPGGQLYLWDWETDAMTRVTRALDGGPSHGGAPYASDLSLSDDGTVATFTTKAYDLVPGDDPNPLHTFDTFAAIIPGGSSA